MSVGRLRIWCQAACWQVGQVHSVQVQFAQVSLQLLQEHAAWLHVGQLQSVQAQEAQLSLQWVH